MRLARETDAYGRLEAEASQEHLLLSGAGADRVIGAEVALNLWMRGKESNL